MESESVNQMNDMRFYIKYNKWCMKLDSAQLDTMKHCVEVNLPE